MKKSIIAIGIVFCFLGLVFMPVLKSDTVNICSGGEGNSNDGFVEVEVYNYKGFYGFEKNTKSLSYAESNQLKSEITTIETLDISFENKIKKRIQIFKEYELIPEDYSYEKIKNMVNKQKFILRLWGYEALFNYLLNKSSNKQKTDFEKGLFSLIYFYIDEVEGISYGVPPWRFIWPLVLPYIPMPVIWATAAFEGWECYLASVGLSGIKDLDRFCRLFLIGFIGISFMGLEIENYKRDVFFHPWAIGFGYSTFWGASYEW